MQRDISTILWKEQQKQLEHQERAQKNLERVRAAKLYKARKNLLKIAQEKGMKVTEDYLKLKMK